MARRRYTEDEKAEALALYATDGPTAVQAQLGIPKQTVQQWASDAGVRTVRNEHTAAATEAARLDWQERRIALAHRMGAVAEKALAVAEEMLDARTPSKAKDAATTMAILADKAQLLTGGATSRQFSHGVQEAVIADARDHALRLVS